MTIRVFEAFAGVGSQRMALRNLGIDHEVVAISDVDEFTVKSYAVIHDDDKVVSQVTDEEMQDYLEKRNIPLNDKGVRKILKGNKLKEFYEACIKSNNLGDISKVVTQDIPDHDLFTYSFPCQDISVAGKGLGLDEGSDTRSGLLWECQKVIYGKRPKYLLLENVKNLIGKKHRHNFDKWLVWLEKQGYTNYWQVLNAKDYGVPQNRERVFVVSILGKHEPYEFPEPVELELRLKDVLEDEVDEKFYLSEEKTQQLVTTISKKHSEKTAVKMNRNEVKDEQDIASTLLARDYKGFGNQDMNGVIEPKAKRIAGIFDKDGTKHQAGAVWDKDQISPALDTMQGGWRQPSVVVDDSNIKPIKNEVVPEVIGGIGEKNFGSQFRQGNRVYDVNKVATALTASPVGNAGGYTPLYGDITNYRIRKLTPKECWRLMGFSDDDFHKAEEVNSNSQLYKQAGNSIVVDVLEGIFKQLLEVAK